MTITFDQGLQIVQAAGSAVTAIVAVCAIVVAVRQIRAGQASTREAAAKDTFREFIKTSIDNPTYAEGDMNSANTLSHAGYLMFVILMLHAMEEVLIYCSLREERAPWLQTIRFYLRQHLRTLMHPEFKSTLYTTCNTELCGLIDEVTNGYRPASAQDNTSGLPFDAELRSRA